MARKTKLLTALGIGTAFAALAGPAFAQEAVATQEAGDALLSAAGPLGGAVTR